MALEMAPAAGDVVVLLTDDGQVRDLNARFRNKDQPTNVLSFPSPPGSGAHLGDVALAYRRLREGGGRAGQAAGRITCSIWWRMACFIL